MGGLVGENDILAIEELGYTGGVAGELRLIEMLTGNRLNVDS
jgi:hypothetical protein